MSNSGLAKVSRRRYNLETVVFSAQQEVTVPAGLKIPVSTQYVLQPFLVVPREKVIILPGPGKIRVQGQTEGFLSYVDRDESVSNLPVPPTEFIASFAVPSAVQGARIEADIRLEGVEVDRGDGEANITAYIRVGFCPQARRNRVGHCRRRQCPFSGVPGDKAPAHSQGSRSGKEHFHSPFPSGGETGGNRFLHRQSRLAGN